MHSIDDLSGKANVRLARETAAIPSDHPAPKALLERSHDRYSGGAPLPRIQASRATGGDIDEPRVLLMAKVSDIVAGANEARA